MKNIYSMGIDDIFIYIKVFLFIQEEHIFLIFYYY